MEESPETFYEEPDGVARIYDEVEEEQDGGVKNLRNQRDSSTKDDVMEDLQDGAWCLRQARSESLKDGFKNGRTRKDAVTKVKI